MLNRADIVNQNFTRRVLAGDLPCSHLNLTPGNVGLADWQVVDLFESQVMSRHLDLVSRRLSQRKQSFYTIGSAGHEGNAVFGRVFRHTDMAFLHYRSAALLIQRSKQLGGQTPLYDMLLSFAASSDDPIAGGRHKVLGSKSLLVPPQTSTIASHLPKAMGTAHAIGLAQKLGKTDSEMPWDSVVLCSFGDASVNHSSAQGAFNAAAWAAYQHSAMPIVFICEDNGIGISTETPLGWIKASFNNRPGLRYMECDGLNLLDTFKVATEAVNFARRVKQPVFLHCRMVRLLGHAGSDVETVYRKTSQIEKIEARDPLLQSAAIIIAAGILEAQQLCEIYNATERRINRIAEISIARPKLSTAQQVMESLISNSKSNSQRPAVVLASQANRRTVFAQDLRLTSQPQPMARLINLALADILLQYQHAVICGEDVGKKGGVYGVTQNLLNKFGPLRVTDTLLDEQSILGLAMGLAHNGFLAIPEIQFLAYLHNAEDQLRGEAATLAFFSQGAFTNPMVVRIAGLAYQKGFGGHFHNDNSFAVLRDIPGLIIACPSNGADAVQLLRTCVKLAHEQRRVVVFLEPIALYMTRDLHRAEDSLWASRYQPPGQGEEIRLGSIGIDGDGTDICIVSYANGFYLSLQAAERMREQNQLNVRIVDLRWLAPLSVESILAAVAPCTCVLIVDECRSTGSISEALLSILMEHGITKPLARVTAEDCFIPLGAAANLVLPSVDSIVDAAIRLCANVATLSTKKHKAGGI